MISRVFRDPIGLDTSKYPVREGFKDAPLQYSNGDNVHTSMENETGNRVPKRESAYSSLDGSTGRTRRFHKESIRRSEGSLLPVRQESEGDRPKEDAARYGILGQAGSSNYRSAGRRKESEEDGIEISQGTAGIGETTISGESGPVYGHGSDSNRNEKTKKRCFLKDLDCSALCMAWSSKKEGCELLLAVDTLLVRSRPKPIMPPAPGVVK